MSKPGRLKRALIHREAIAIPTLVATPCPRESVVFLMLDGSVSVFGMSGTFAVHLPEAANKVEALLLACRLEPRGLRID